LLIERIVLTSKGCHSKYTRYFLAYFFTALKDNCIHQINGKDSKTVKTSESRKKNPIDVMAGAGLEFYSLMKMKIKFHR